MLVFCSCFPTWAFRGVISLITVMAASGQTIAQIAHPVQPLEAKNAG